ncbi:MULTISPECIES: hypothetical protein [Streptomyces]|jgi:hypothetical protein|uniref:hypothetical protein n=1 Tax=Streptomyces TaxID=1883 RepID=UPI0019071E32|nr:MULTISPECIES: hypothetical protein [unclassified Streptomyces]MCU4746188.1 hypothetical protein [Streptomyces sp. G-5]QQN76507.1 hypothetical protein IPZ77_02865 [Streptomyces sp. XC 2026]
MTPREEHGEPAEDTPAAAPVPAAPPAPAGKRAKGGELPPGFLPRLFLYGVLGHVVVALIFLMVWAGSRAQ